MFTEQSLSPVPFGKITQTTHDEHKKLYAGYVKNANMVHDLLEKGTWEGDGGIYAKGELYRRFAFEYNGMRNHEVYFALATGPNSTAPTLIAAIEKQWESLDMFKQSFITLATTRGIGWGMLSYDRKIAALIMHWVDEQHLGQLQGTTPIIALDMWEHSYVTDYQPSGKKQYVEDFLSSMNWSVAEALFEAARSTH